jgi:putative hydrolase of the HAD superfamily
MPITTILFDLDNTLYPHSSGVWDAAVARIELFMRDRVGLPQDQLAALRMDYLARYGTTLRGLYEEHAINRDEYLDFIHDVDIEGLLPANPALVAMLAALPQRKLIFTNASRAHAWRVLAALGVQDAFDDIISLEDLDYISKPDPSVYPLVYRLAGAQSAGGTLFVDDQARNLDPARALGWGTVLVGGSPNGEHPHIERVEDLPLALPALVK